MSHAVSGDATSPGLVKAHGGAVVIPGSSKQEFGAGRSSGVVLAESRSAVISTCALQRGGVPHGTPLQSEGSERRDGRRPGRPVTSAPAPAPASGHTPGRSVRARRLRMNRAAGRRRLRLPQASAGTASSSSAVMIKNS